MRVRSGSLNKNHHHYYHQQQEDEEGEKKVFIVWNRFELS